ncbi:PDDEXK-like family protein [Pseudomonas taeanensis]|uniref:PDDEXK-like family protein n=1 Tax=Pseudomonas taeanensis TaxID=574962 RepID=UPI000469FFBB|nr:PD-(D/E)XK nuclease family protein [Pseudomonas taeanensis]
MNTSQSMFQALASSSELAELSAYSKEFDLFKVMGVRSKELVHSNILANLLNKNEPHGLQDAFINALLGSLTDLEVFGPALLQENLAAAFGADSRISRELESIDLVVEFPAARLVIAIENKIWAGEQPQQIERYQETLLNRYPSYHHGLVFLTPSGRPPETINFESQVPVYCMSYGQISSLLRGSSASARPAAAIFINQFIGHVERYMSGNSEINALCWELFSKHEEACRHMAKAYEYCVDRKIRMAFATIEERLRNDSMFVDWASEIEVRSNYREDRKVIVKCDLDFRLKSWPEHLWVKVYKHTWLGVFPFTIKDHLKTMADTFPAAFNIARPVRSWDGHYYISANPINDNERCILQDGNDLDEVGINLTLNRVREYVSGICQALNQQSSAPIVSETFLHVVDIVE